MRTSRFAGDATILWHSNVNETSNEAQTATKRDANYCTVVLAAKGGVYRAVNQARRPRMIPAALPLGAPSANIKSFKSLVAMDTRATGTTFALGVFRILRRSTVEHRTESFDASPVGTRRVLSPVEHKAVTHQCFHALSVGTTRAKSSCERTLEAMCCRATSTFQDRIVAHTPSGYQRRYRALRFPVTRITTRAALPA